jgi:hypothetical protein
MKKENIFISVLLIALILLCAGFALFVHAQRKQQRGLSEFYISVHDAMYRCAVIGNTQAVEKIRTTLDGLLWYETREYKLRYGEVVGTNGFAKSFASASQVADKVHMVPLSSLTNAFTNVTIHIKTGE